MSKIGMARNTEQEVEAPNSSIEEQLNLLHDYLDTLDGQMGLLRENLSEVLCPVPNKGPMNGVEETPVMSQAAERIFTAQRRVVEHMILVGWLNENLNIKSKSLMKGQN